jgi:guanidinopropionase
VEFKPISGREFPRFSAIKTFFRLPHAPVTENFDVALVGVPFDGGVSYRPGARFAPTQVREYSSLGRGFHWNRGLNVFEKTKFADVGDAPVVPIDLQKTYTQIETFVGDLHKRSKRTLCIGGDHSITLPLLRAVHKKHGPVRLIHFDAHLDTYPAAWGCEYHHGAFLRHAVEEKLIKPEGSWQFGLRGPLAEGQDLDFVKKHKFKSTTIDDIRINGLETFIKSIPDFGSDPVYITFDVDCLDPAFAPGTGTPVPGGLSTYETQRILRALKIKNLVGADIVEVCPAYDPSGITAIAAVDTMFEIMCHF